MKKLIYSLIAVFFIVSSLKSQELIFENDYDVSFEEPDAQTKDVRLNFLNHDHSIVTEEGDIIILLECRWSNLPVDELSFFTIAKFDKDYNLLWRTSIKFSDNLVNFSMDTLDNTIRVDASYCIEGGIATAWFNCHPALFVLSMSGDMVENHFVKGSSTGYYHTEKTIRYLDKFVFITGDVDGLLFQHRSLDDFEILRTDTIIFKEEGKGPAMVDDYVEVKEGIFMIVGPTSGSSQQATTSIVVYNSNDKTSFLIEDENMDMAPSYTSIFLTDSKAVLHSSKVITVIDLETFEVVNSTTEKTFRNEDESKTASFSSVDLNENDEFLIPMNIYINDGKYWTYKIIKTDINFNILWEKSFDSPDGKSGSIQSRELVNNNVLSARMVNSETLRLQVLKDDPAGVNELPPTAKLSLYPNPASDKLFIEQDTAPDALQTGDIQIINPLGMEVASFALSSIIRENSGYSIDVSHLAPGVYFVKMGASTAKFIVTK